MRNAYNLYGYTQPQIFFTDNVIGDQSFLKNVLPSLLQDVIPITEDESQEPLNLHHYQLLAILSSVEIKCVLYQWKINNKIKEMVICQTRPKRTKLN